MIRGARALVVYFLVLTGCFFSINLSASTHLPVQSARSSRAETEAPRADVLRFTYRAERAGSVVKLAADYFEWDSDRWVFKEIEPKLHVLEIPRPWTSALEYKLVVDGVWMRDPANPKKTSDGYGGYNSLVDDIGFTDDPWLEPLDASEPRWKTSRISIPDPEGIARTITVLHPPLAMISKAASSKTVTVYFQDGNDYLDLTGVQNLLSRLATYHPELPLITGVFIPPRDRMNEYGLSAKSAAYGEFLANVVVPKIEARFATGGSSGNRMLMGPSLGGLITLETGLRYPQVFGLIASQSGSIWYKEEGILDFFKPGTGKNQKFFMDVGIFETDGMVSLNRKAHARAKALGWDITYREYPSTHTWSAWRNRLREIFLTLLPRSENR